MDTTGPSQHSGRVSSAHRWRVRAAGAGGALAQELLRSPEAEAVGGVLSRHDPLSVKQMSKLICMLGRDAGFEGKQRLDWVMAWAAERKEPHVGNFNSYMTQLARQRGRLRDAEAVLYLMQAEQMKPDAHTYNSFIRAYDQEGQWLAAEAAFERMQAAWVTPNEYSYSFLISAYAKGEQWQAAEVAFKQMQAAGLTPTVYTYSSLISAYRKGEQWQAAEEVEEAFAQMQAAKVMPPSS